MLSLGIDIGGANTKAVSFTDDVIENEWLEHIPLWKGTDKLYNFLEDLQESVNPHTVGITMTAELCDIFESKKKGARKIVKKGTEIFQSENIFYLSKDGVLLPPNRALKSIEKLSASNWMASGLLVGRKFSNCLLIDIGSTTTDLIPIKDGKPAPEGWTDFERLQTKELVYTGLLRTPPPYLKSTISLNDTEIGIASEYFANMADVYRVLDILEEENYTCETPDGRGKDKENCKRRIARLVCSDLEEIGEDTVKKIARKVHHAQINQIRNAIVELKDLHEIKNQTPTIVTGIGGEKLAKKSAEKADLEKIIPLSDLYGETAEIMTPAFALGIMAFEEASI